MRGILFKPRHRPADGLIPRSGPPSPFRKPQTNSRIPGKNGSTTGAGCCRDHIFFSFFCWETNRKPLFFLETNRETNRTPPFSWETNRKPPARRGPYPSPPTNPPPSGGDLRSREPRRRGSGRTSAGSAAGPPAPGLAMRQTKKRANHVRARDAGAGRRGACWFETETIGF